MYPLGVWRLVREFLFITPLRALSAQTESSLRKTFLPLGKSVSSLYGSIGTSDFEQDVIKTQKTLWWVHQKNSILL